MAEEFAISSITVYNKSNTSSKISFSSLKSTRKEKKVFSKSIPIDLNRCKQLSEVYDTCVRVSEHVKKHIKSLYDLSEPYGYDLSLAIIGKEVFRLYTNFTNYHKELFFRLALTNVQGVKIIRDVPINNSIASSWDTLLSILRSILQMSVVCVDHNQISINSIKNINYILCAPQFTSFLFHEIIGHLLEYDYFSSGECFFSEKNIGSQIFSKNVNVIDDPLATHSLGIDFGLYDDSGNDLRKTKVINAGKLINPIKTQRVDSVKHLPIYRMYNLHLRPDSNGPNYSDLLQKVDCGISINNSSSGNINPYSGEVHMQCKNCYLIYNGNIVAPIYDFDINCNLKNIISNISSIGSDFEPFISQCIKSGQVVTVGTGGPSIMIYNESILKGATNL